MWRRIALMLTVLETASALAGWTAYQALLIERPLLTKSVTSSVIMTVSDALTQHLESRIAAAREVSPSSSPDSSLSRSSNPSCVGRRSHNWSRSRQSMLTGLVWSGPVAHYWYQSLEILVKSVLRLPSNPLLQLVARIALDAVLFSPFTIAGFFVVATLVQGGTVGEIVNKLRTRWRRALVAAWSFWPVVNVANFGLVSLPYRVLYSNVMSLLWTGYLSYVNNLKQATNSKTS
jgi:protein Mpv17